MQSEEPIIEVTVTEEQPTEKPTTIKVPTALKDELDLLKEDEKETYAGVIGRLIHARPEPESDNETVVVSLPRRVYQMMLMLLPGNMSDQMRKGVR